MWLGGSEKVASKWADHYFFLFCRHVPRQSAKGGMHDRGSHFWTFFCAISWAEEMHVLLGTGDTGGKRFDFSYTLPFPYLAIGIFPYFFLFFRPTVSSPPFGHPPLTTLANWEREREKKRIHHVSSRSEKFANRISSSKPKNLLKNRAHANGEQKKTIYLAFCKRQRVVVEIHPSASWVSMTELVEWGVDLCLWPLLSPLPLLPKRIMFPENSRPTPSTHSSWERRGGGESWVGIFLVCAEPKRRGGKGWWVDN